MDHVKRTRKMQINQSKVLTNEELKRYASALVARTQLASRLGTMSYDGNRDIYQALGYPKELTFVGNYLPQYIRQDIAKAVIDRPVRAAWRGGLEIHAVGSEGEESSIEKAWNELEKQFKIHTILMRLDKLVGIGRYGVLLMGLNDVTKIEDLQTPAMGASKKLIYLKPLSEESAKISTYEQNQNNPRYGKPLMYNVTISSQEGVGMTVLVHYTRIIHVAEDILEDETLGTPRLQAIFNRLIDLEKIIGGSAEMYWRGARPGYKGEVDKDFTLTPSGEEGIQDQFDEYENNLRRFLLLEGVKVSELKQQLADPSKNVDVQIQMISAVTGIPKRILVGSERGELSSSQDREEWNLWVQSRREEFMEPMIVRSVVDRFIELGILPKTKEYHVHWDELFAMSPTERSKIAETFANAIRYYTATPTAEYILPKELFLKKLLGLTDEEMKEAMKLVDELPEPPVTVQEQQAIGSDIGGKNPASGTGNDTVAKKQKATP